MGKNLDVSTKISVVQPKAITTHRRGHPLSLAVKPLTKERPILQYTMGTVVKNCDLVFFETRKNVWQTNRK